MKFPVSLSTASNAVFIAVSLLLVGMIARQRLFPPAAPVPPGRALREVADWTGYGAVGHRIGSPQALVTIVEFADFECPVCRVFTNGALKAARAEFGDTVAVVFRHMPLSNHKLAYPTARAAECASSEGRFEAFHDAVYSHQDSLGILPISEFARRAGVRDMRKFELCNGSSERVPAIDVDVAAAKALGASGTPTLLINSVLVPGAPDSSRLVEFIRKAIATRRAH